MISERGDAFLGKMKRLFAAALAAALIFLGAAPAYAAHENEVHVIVENTTYLKSEGAKWDGRLVDLWVPITSDSTMMSCVVAALNEDGYEQVGAGNGYISSIDGLAEFNGGSGSGWMGTLNDWFVNLGFENFTVADGNLSEGDEIRVMYTKNRGVDLGGSWESKDTTLKALAATGGTLSAMKTSSVSGIAGEYDLVISGASANVKLTPTANNKNYLVKAFLNQKVTANTEAEGVFYKRTVEIPVEAGDKIYIGIGETAWPSMNGQGTEATEYSASWYVVNVVSESLKKGDVNGDGKVTVRDISAIRTKILSGNTATAQEIAVMDMNGDEKITVRDISAVRAIILAG